jgi:outer membrane protein OmpA-like peptidoglycan-associated protein
VAFRVDIPSVDSEPTEPTRPVTLIVEDLFASGSEALSPVADTRLEDILDEVGTDRGGPRVEILGSCDDTNQPAACLEQAVVRARAVANWLADEGVPVRRLSVRGAGARQPIIDEHRRPEATDQQVELRLDPDPSDQQSPRD